MVLLRSLILSATLLYYACSFAWASDDLVLADFESESYAPWIVTGDAFGPGPARGTLANQMPVSGYRGAGLVNSYFGGDVSQGTLTSPEFRIERRFITFWIGGGKNEQLALQLLIDGKVVRSSTGNNDRPGGTEELTQGHWDVSEFDGQRAVLRIVDHASGGWGHINVDHIVQTDTKPKGFILDVQRSMVATQRYLHFPIKNGAAKRMVTLLVDGQPIVKNEIELADGAVDWWAPMDVSAWDGKTLTIQVDRLHEDSQALNQIQSSDALIGAEDLYREPLRGQFHFSPMRGWNNDPNGCVYFNGEYHLFFQHNPYGWGWGNMHWGHAVSKDLVHWEELGDVLLPDSMGPMFSGSAVVDWNNTSGFGRDGKIPLVLIYTAAGNPTVQGIAYSLDGRHFTKYEANPVLEQVTGGNRDPKVFWHEPTQKWVMTLYVECQGQHTIHFFTSPNLKDWTLASKCQGDAQGGRFLFECPDMFELAVDGDPSRKKWVLIAANSEYAIGDFDGTSFVPDATRIPGHRGRGFYAAQSFSDIPDGRRILIGWWQTETKGMPFNQSMTIPLELGLMQTEEGPRMTFAPVKELERLRTKTHSIHIDSLGPENSNPLQGIQSELVEIRVEFEPDEAKAVLFNIRDIMVEYDTASQMLSVAGHRVSAPLREGKQRWTIYCDRTGAEVFACDGLCYVPMPYNTDPQNKNLYFEARGGIAKVHSLEVHELRSTWNTDR